MPNDADRLRKLAEAVRTLSAALLANDRKLIFQGVVSVSYWHGFLDVGSSYLPRDLASAAEQALDDALKVLGSGGA